MYYPEYDGLPGMPGMALESSHSGFGGLSIQPISRPMYSMSADRVQDAAPALAAGPPGQQDSSAPVIEIRKTFPETWIFDSFDFNST